MTKAVVMAEAVVMVEKKSEEVVEVAEVVEVVEKAVNPEVMVVIPNHPDNHHEQVQYHCPA
jgi:hypothetical protein